MVGGFELIIVILGAIALPLVIVAIVFATRKGGHVVPHADDYDDGDGP